MFAEEQSGPGQSLGSLPVSATKSAQCCATAAHSSLLTPALSNVEMLSGPTKTPMGNGDFHLQDMVQLQAGVLLEKNKIFRPVARRVVPGTSNMNWMPKLDQGLKFF